MTSTTTDRRFGTNSGVAVKAPCKAATTANITLSAEQTIDGVSCVTNDRILVKDQTDATENGIYTVDTGEWSRAPDFDGSYDVVSGTLVKVNQGSTNQGFWYVTTSDTITIGTSSIAFGQASSVLAVISAFAQTLLDDTSASAALTTLGVTAAAQTVLDDATVAAMLATMGGAPLASPTFTGTPAAPTAADNTDSTQIATTAFVQNVLPKNHLSGLGLSNAADADHDLTIAVGECQDSSDTVGMFLTSAITKQFDATFAEGDAAGGMASGESLPTSGTVHIWLISKTDGTTDVFGNNHATSGLSPTLPTGYIYKRRIKSVYTDSSANIVAFIQLKFRTLYKAVQPATLSTAHTTAETVTLPVPAGINVVAFGWAGIERNGAGLQATYFYSPDATAETTAPNTNGRCTVAVNSADTADQQNFAYFEVMTNTSGQMKHVESSIDASASVSCGIAGYYDYLDT